VKVKCVFCGEEISPQKPNHPEEVGFVDLRGKVGGTHSLHLARRTGNWACNTCVDIRRSRGKRKQRDSLF
jgi:hypothetical protein